VDCTTLEFTAGSRKSLFAIMSILEAAHARHCGTVVVGRKSYHGLTALVTSHVSDELISQGEGLTVWVVE
jgi:hypothetical protein